ncbi:MAG: flagellar hook-basal body complex protein FliE [Phycisphaerales bacterium]|nr:flagellar hook-basal body complex protein FliE [Phycisphaerales bacterium]
MSDPLGLIRGVGGVGGGAPMMPRTPAGGAPVDPSGPSFKDVLMANLREVNKLQQEATTAVEDLMTGERKDLENVILATNKADTAFRMLLSVRNKVQQAYEEIKQIRV